MMGILKEIKAALGSGKGAHLEKPNNLIPILIQCPNLIFLTYYFRCFIQSEAATGHAHEVCRVGLLSCNRPRATWVHIHWSGEKIGLVRGLAKY